MLRFVSPFVILILMACFIILFLEGCGMPVREEGKLIGYEVQKATITGVNHPKHFSVSIRTDEGLVYRDTARSKHCVYSHARAIVGRRYDVVLNVYQRKDGTTTKHLDSNKLNDLLCW